MTNPTWNFGAGPAMIPRTVLEKANSEFLDFGGSGMSVMELSHRSKEFEGILNKADKDLRSLLRIPNNYTVLYLQGGATTQFAAIVYNLIKDKNAPVDYMVSGGWSDKAAKEAKALGANVNIVFDTKKSGYNGIPPKSEWKLSGDKASYVYYCANETVHGVEFNEVPEVDSSVPLVCDMSSNILSRDFDITKFGLVYFGAQKNVGPSGLTVVIIRNDLIGTRKIPEMPVPIMFDYKTQAENNSLYNTPPTYAIYISGLVFEDLLTKGGIPAIEKVNIEKANLLYSTLAKYPKLYKAVVQEGFRSRMNVPFRILGEDGNPSDERETAFLKGAVARKMVQLKGHRSVGGIRASIYNAMPLEGVQFLCKYLEEFAKEQGM